MFQIIDFTEQTLTHGGGEFIQLVWNCRQVGLLEHEAGLTRSAIFITDHIGHTCTCRYAL